MDARELDATASKSRYHLEIGRMRSRGAGVTNKIVPMSAGRKTSRRLSGEGFAASVRWVVRKVQSRPRCDHDFGGGMIRVSGAAGGGSGGAAELQDPD